MKPKAPRTLEPSWYIDPPIDDHAADDDALDELALHDRAKAERQRERRLDEAVIAVSEFRLLDFNIRYLRDLWFLWRHGIIPINDEN